MKKIKKDITTVEKGIIFHQVNCMGVMGSGVAKAIKVKFPKVFEEYSSLCKDAKMYHYQKDLLGSIQKIRLNRDLLVINCFSQYNFGLGKKHTVEGILIENIRTICKEYPDQDVHIPYLIGAGTGGGDWGVIFGGIRDLDNLVICELPK